MKKEGTFKCDIEDDTCLITLMTAEEMGDDVAICVPVPAQSNASSAPNNTTSKKAHKTRLYNVLALYEYIKFQHPETTYPHNRELIDKHTIAAVRAQANKIKWQHLYNSAVYDKVFKNIAKITTAADFKKSWWKVKLNPHTYASIYDFVEQRIINILRLDPKVCREMHGSVFDCSVTPARPIGVAKLSKVTEVVANAGAVSIINFKLVRKDSPHGEFAFRIKYGGLDAIMALEIIWDIGDPNDPGTIGSTKIFVGLTDEKQLKELIERRYMYGNDYDHETRGEGYLVDLGYGETFDVAAPERVPYEEQVHFDPFSSRHIQTIETASDLQDPTWKVNKQTLFEFLRSRIVGTLSMDTDKNGLHNNAFFTDHRARPEYSGSMAEDVLLGLLRDHIQVNNIVKDSDGMVDIHHFQLVRDFSVHALFSFQIECDGVGAIVSVEAFWDENPETPPTDIEVGSLRVHLGMTADSDAFKELIENRNVYGNNYDDHLVYLGFGETFRVPAPVSPVSPAKHPRLSGGKKTKSYTKTGRTHVCKDGVKRTLYEKNGVFYVKRLSAKTATYRYRKTAL